MSNRHFIAIILAYFVLAGCTPHSGGSFGYADASECGFDSSVLDGVDDLINAGIEAGTYPGAVLSVVKEDKIVYLKAYGSRQTVPVVEPMTTETVFDLASLSKCLGPTIAAMQLIEQGRLSLSDDVAQYLPGFKPWTDVSTGESVDITVRDLMTHTSGLDAEIIVNDYIERFGTSDADSLELYISNIVNRNFEPGSGLLYSCVNFLTLQIILERITGMRLCDYVKKNIYDVLGLKHTMYIPDGEMIPLCAATEVQPDGLPLVGIVHDPTARIINKGNSGNAGLFSDAYDLSYMAAAIMNGGEIDGKRILTEESVKLMTTVPSDIPAQIGRALGWDKSSPSSSLKGTGFSDNTICHTGYTGTSMVIDMDSKVAVILLTNRVHPSDSGSVVKLRAQVADIVSESMEKFRKWPLNFQ